MEIRRKDELKLTDGKKFGEVVAVDRTALHDRRAQGAAQADEHPTAVVRALARSDRSARGRDLSRSDETSSPTAVSVGKGKPDRSRGACSCGSPPGCAPAPSSQRLANPPSSFAVRIAGDLDETVLAIQGPPGSGKTYSGAQMICALVRQGKKVGVTATSHKVIRNLLDAVGKAAEKAGVGVTLGSQEGRGRRRGDDVVGRRCSEQRGRARRPARPAKSNVLGGTAWLWARPEFAEAVDVLFVDEAGQMSLANVLAVSQAAESIVLLGDPQQLEQPQKGSHPDGVNASALQHILAST